MTDSRTPPPSAAAPHPLGHRVTLPGGGSVRIRPITPDDRTELGLAYQRLSPESRRLRFLSPPNHLTEDMLRRLTCVDGVNHAALVAIAEDEPGQPGVGVARYVRLGEGSDTAEVAVTVLDDHENRGIGTLLLEMLLEKALRNGVRHIRGYVAAENRILDLARAFDASITPDSPGVVLVDVTLPGAPHEIRSAVRAAALTPGAAARTPTSVGVSATSPRSTRRRRCRTMPMCRRPPRRCR
ncbi:MAG TPA: GNAT family N-acetyltransferase [Candidatus Dormibacteraeota bacterium]|nr:GNAT family N-acetyltransferase [Candidatus Dormibacteraeota bacterium]